MAETATVEPPVETKIELPNPVIPSDMDLSKKFFNDAMAAEKPPAEAQETGKEAATSTTTPETTKTEQVVESEKDKGDIKADIPPAAKSKLPEELITGKKEEPKVDDAIAEIDAMVLPKNAKPEQVASFGKLKEAAKKTIEEKLGRIRELETKTSDGATRAEIETAQERVKKAEDRSKELESTIERLAFTESPRFKQFIAEETASLSSAKSYFEGTEINPEIIEVAARSVGSQRIKVLTDAGADANLIAAVSPYLAQYDSIQRQKAGSIENWKTESVQYAEAQKAQHDANLAQRKQQEDKIWDTTMSKFENELVPYRKFDNSDPWNARADELKAKAKSVYNGEGISLDVVADTIAKGVAYDALEEVRVALTEEIRKLATENARLKAAKPTGGDTQGTSGANGTIELSPTDQAKKRFNDAMAAVKGGA